MHDLRVSISEQKLVVYSDAVFVTEYPIATAKNGTGQQEGSFCTPLGQHQIGAKIGADEPINTVFQGRVPTGEVYTPKLGKEHPKRDWILTRILWLDGLEPGLNQGGEVDSKSRYIYIHGVPDTKDMGVPGSKGCINLHNKNMIELFSLVEVGDKVLIEE